MNKPPKYPMSKDENNNIQLIIIDENDKIVYYKECQIIVSKPTKDILLRPVNRDAELIRVSFERTFVRHNTILCIDNCETNSNKYFLIFPSNERCKIISDGIKEEKSSKFNNDILNNEIFQSFITKFLTPILIACKDDIDLENQLEPFLVDFLDFYNNYQGQQQNASSENQSSETSSTIQKDENLKNVCNDEWNNRKRNLRERARKDKGFYNVNNFKIIPSDSINEKGVHEFQRKINVSPLKKQKMTESEVSADDPLRVFKPKYNIVYRKVNGKRVERLAIFDSVDSTLCRELTWHAKRKNYICSRCVPFSVYVTAKLIQGEDGGEYVLLNGKKHGCRLRKFMPTNCEIRPNLNASASKSLKRGCSLQNSVPENSESGTNLNASASKSLKRGCSLQNSVPESSESGTNLNISALEGPKRKCSLQSSVPNSETRANLNASDSEDPKYGCTHEKSLLENFEMGTNLNTSASESPEFRLMKGYFRGRTVRHMYIFDAENRNMCYKYTLKTKSKNFKKYYCNKCDRINGSTVWAAVFKDENGDKYVELGPTKHSCELQSFADRNLKQSLASSKKSSNSGVKVRTESEIVENFAPDYQVIFQSYRNDLIKHLIIYDAVNKNLCYKLTWNQYKKKFFCQTCKFKHQASVWAKLVKNENGEECLELNPIQHKCKPQKFEDYGFEEKKDEA